MLLVTLTLEITLFLDEIISSSGLFILHRVNGDLMSHCVHMQFLD